MSNIPFFNVGINLVFKMLTLELKIFSTETDMVSQEQKVLWKKGRL